MTAAHRIQQAEVRVSAFARAVALRRAAILAVAGALLSVAASQGWITAGASDHINALVAGGFGFLATVGAGAWIHPATTPAKQSLQPRNADGQPLIPDPSRPAGGGLLPADVDLNGALADLRQAATAAGRVTALVSFGSGGGASTQGPASVAYVQPATGADGLPDPGPAQPPVDPDPFMEGGGANPDNGGPAVAAPAGQADGTAPSALGGT